MVLGSAHLSIVHADPFGLHGMLRVVEDLRPSLKELASAIC